MSTMEMKTQVGAGNEGRRAGTAIQFTVARCETRVTTLPSMAAPVPDNDFFLEGCFYNG